VTKKKKPRRKANQSRAIRQATAGVSTGAGGSRGDRIRKAVGWVIAFSGWQSAVVLYVAYHWNDLFGSDVGSDVWSALKIAFALFVAFAMSGMGFVPIVAEPRRPH
jgi:hypothetical protein